MPPFALKCIFSVISFALPVCFGASAAETAGGSGTTGVLPKDNLGLSGSAVPGAGTKLVPEKDLIPLATFRLVDSQHIALSKTSLSDNFLAVGKVSVQEVGGALLIRVLPGGKLKISLGEFADAETTGLPELTVVLRPDKKHPGEFLPVEGLHEKDSDLLRWALMNHAPGVQLGDLDTWQWSPPWKINGKKSKVPADFIMERYPVEVEISTGQLSKPKTPDLAATGLEMEPAAADAVMKGLLKVTPPGAELGWSGVGTVEISTFTKQVAISNISSALYSGSINNPLGVIDRVTRILSCRMAEAPAGKVSAGAPPEEALRVSAAYHAVTVLTLGRGVQFESLDRASAAQFVFIVAVDKALADYGAASWPELLASLNKLQPGTPAPAPIFHNRMLKWYLVGGGAAAFIGGGFAMKDTIVGTPDRMQTVTGTLPAHDPAVVLAWEMPDNMDLEVRDSVNNLASPLTPDGVPGATHAGDTVTAGEEEVYWTAGVQNDPFTVTAINKGTIPCQVRVTLIDGTSQQTIDLGTVDPGQSSFPVEFSPGQ